MKPAFICDFGRQICDGSQPVVQWYPTWIVIRKDDGSSHGFGKGSFPLTTTQSSQIGNLTIQLKNESLISHQWVDSIKWYWYSTQSTAVRIICADVAINCNINLHAIVRRSVHPVRAVRELNRSPFQKSNTFYIVKNHYQNQIPLHILTLMAPVVFNHVPIYVENGLVQILPRIKWQWQINEVSFYYHHHTQHTYKGPPDTFPFTSILCHSHPCNTTRHAYFVYLSNMLPFLQTLNASRISVQDFPYATTIFPSGNIARPLQF